MFDVILSVFTAFAITLMAIPAIITVAERKKLFDIPDERKIHRLPIPSLGGLGIFAGFVMACFITMPFHQAPELQYFFAAAIVIFFLGLKDDILIISPIKKFIGQVIAAFLIIYLGGAQIHSAHGFAGIYELPEHFSLLLTYFTVLVIVNSFNLIDGIDGLAGSLGVIASALFGVYFLMVDQIAYAILAFAACGSTAAFLIFNFHPARIFMGDTGSLLLGLINSVLVIKFINISQSAGNSFPISSAPAIGFAILVIPLMDTLRVFAIRIFNRRSPFSPDRNHVHHLLLDRGLSHRAITLSLVGANLLIVALALLLRDVGTTWLILGIIAFFFLGIALLYATRARTRLFVAKAEPQKSPVRQSTKIVSLTKDSILEEKN